MLMYLSFGIIFLLGCLRCLHTFTQWVGATSADGRDALIHKWTHHSGRPDMRHSVEVNCVDISIGKTTNGTTLAATTEACLKRIAFLLNAFRELTVGGLVRSVIVCGFAKITSATRRTLADELRRWKWLNKSRQIDHNSLDLYDILATTVIIPSPLK